MSTEVESTPWERDACYARAEGVILRSIAGEALLVPIRKDLADLREIFTLNPVGARIWGHLDGELTLGGVLAALLEQFEVSEAEARADLASFVAQLHEARLVDRRA